MGSQEREAYYRERDQNRAREVAASKIRGSEKSIANLQAALELAEAEKLDDAPFRTIILQEIERYKTDIINTRRQLILDLSGARLNDHEF